MTDRTLAVTVHVHVDGETHVFEAGATPPDWACELISNPDAWTDVEGSRSGAGAEQRPADISPGVGGPPPRHGAGSGRDAWAAYAADHGVPVGEEMSRADILDALDAADIPTD